MLFDEVLDEWLNGQRSKLKPTTCGAYETILNRHIRPEFTGGTPWEITDSDIARFWERKCGENLSASTLRGISCVLRATVRYGGRYGCNAGTDACRHAPVANRSDASILSDDETARIVSQLGKNPIGRALGVLICLYTGLRLGEICGLRWGDIPPDNRSLTVNRTVSRIRSTEEQRRTRLYIGEPKSRNSCRKIPLPQLLTSALENTRGLDGDYVLTDSTHIPDPRSMQRFFRDLLDNSGVQTVNFHALRHTFATRCVDLGFDIKVLSLILGHSDVSVTMNTYVHPSFERMRSMMSLLDG